MVVKCTSLRLHRCPCNCWHCDSLTKSVLLQALSLPRLPDLKESSIVTPCMVLTRIHIYYVSLERPQGSLVDLMDRPKLKHPISLFN